MKIFDEQVTEDMADSQVEGWLKLGRLQEQVTEKYPNVQVGETKRQKDKKTKRQKDKRQRPKREFDIAMSGQFRTLAMFSSIHQKLYSPTGFDIFCWFVGFV